MIPGLFRAGTAITEDIAGENDAGDLNNPLNTLHRICYLCLLNETDKFRGKCEAGMEESVHIIGEKRRDATRAEEQRIVEPQAKYARFVSVWLW